MCNYNVVARSVTTVAVRPDASRAPRRSVRRTHTWPFRVKVVAVHERERGELHHAIDCLPRQGARAARRWRYLSAARGGYGGGLQVAPVGSRGRPCA